MNDDPIMNNAAFREWETEFDRMVGHVFGMPAEEFAQHWWAGRIGQAEE